VSERAAEHISNDLLMLKRRIYIYIYTYLSNNSEQLQIQDG